MLMDDAELFEIMPITIITLNLHVDLGVIMHTT